MKVSRLANLLLLTGGLVVGLLASEAAVRLAGIGTDRPNGYAPVDTRRRGGGPTNAAGYRDEERSLAKPAGARRVVVLGDSFAWGVGVEFEDAWPQRLQRLLRRRRSEAWEVVSLARPGLNTVEEAELLAEQGLAYEPDAVVVGFCLNDSEDQDAAELRRARDWQALREARQRRRGGEPLLERSALYRFAAGRVRATREGRRRIDNYRSQFAEDYAGWQASRRALREMQRLCAERRVPLLVVVFPLFGNPLDEAYPFAALHPRISAAVAEAGARPLDLLPAYRGLRWELLVVDGTHDEHPNEIAHRIAANAILASLVEMLPPPSSARPEAAPGAASAR